MTDYSELVKALRSTGLHVSAEAADAIEALQAHRHDWLRIAQEANADRDHWKARAERAEAVAADLADPAGEYYTGLGCGLEDRDIHDRYEAAVYGWQQAFQYINSAEPALEHQEGEQ